MQTAALALASNSCFRFRWVPSEWNPSDGPSRGSFFAAVPSADLSERGAPIKASKCPAMCDRQCSFEGSEQGGEGPQGSAPRQPATADDAGPESICQEPAFVLPSFRKPARGQHSSKLQVQVQDGHEKHEAHDKELVHSRSVAAAGEHASIPGAAKICWHAHAAAALHGLDKLSGGGLCGQASGHRWSDADGVDRQAPGTIHKSQLRGREGAGGESQAPSPMGVCVLGCGPGAQRRIDAHRHGHPDHLRVVFEAQGSLPHSLQGPGGTSERHLLEPQLSSNGGGVVQVRVPGCSQASHEQDSGRVAGAPSNLGLSHDQLFGEAGGSTRLGANDSPWAPLPPPPWKSKLRPRIRPDEPAGDSTCRPIEVNEVPSSLREGRAAGTTACKRARRSSHDERLSEADGPVEEPVSPASYHAVKLALPHKNHAIFNPCDQPVALKRRKQSKHSKRRVMHRALEIPRPFKQRFFLEIFSGAGHLASKIAAHVPMVVMWDSLFGALYDLTCKSKQQLIFGWILADWIIGLHMGTPCSSFSCARDQGGGPPRLRSDSSPLDLADPRPGDQKAVVIGNCLMHFSAKCLRLCISRRVSASSENPRLSRLWLCPPTCALGRSHHVTFEHCDFCMFGTHWKKVTGIMACFLDLSGLSRFRCLGSSPGICARTGNRHFVLSGVDSSGKFWTKRAEPYPLRFCNLLAKMYVNCLARQKAEGFWKHIALRPFLLVFLFQVVYYIYFVGLSAAPLIGIFRYTGFIFEYRIW